MSQESQPQPQDDRAADDRSLASVEPEAAGGLDSPPDVIARSGPDLRHVHVSPAVESLVGRPAEGGRGRTNRELGLPPELSERWDAALQRVFRSGRSEAFEFRLSSAGGSRQFDCRLVPETDAAGAVTFVISVARDVTARREALEKERRARLDAEESALRLKSLSRRLVEAQERERRLIARELHDEAGQALTSMRYGLRLLEREIREGGDVAARVAELVERTDAVIDGLHRLAAELRPASLELLGLEAALRQYARTVETQSGLAIHFKARGLAGDRLPADVETALYRVAQEALTNVARHAAATRVDLYLERRGDRLVVVIEDDGAGFRPEEAARGERLGLLGMKERAEALGGSLQVESAPGAGTTLVVEVSLADPHPDR